MIKTLNFIQLKQALLLIILLSILSLNINAQSQSYYSDCDCDSLNIEYTDNVLSLFDADQIGVASFSSLPSDTLEWLDNRKKNYLIRPKTLSLTLGEATKSGILNFEHISEFEILNKKERHNLKNILFKCKKNEASRSFYIQCYNPRNAIFFLDYNNKVKGYIEICLECLQSVLVPKELPISIICEKDYKNLKSFFQEIGIKKGIIHKDDE